MFLMVEQVPQMMMSVEYSICHGWPMGGVGLAFQFGTAFGVGLNDSIVDRRIATGGKSFRASKKTTTGQSRLWSVISPQPWNLAGAALENVFSPNAVCETCLLMSTVAKWFVVGLSAAAKSKRGWGFKRVPFCVNQMHCPGYVEGALVQNLDGNVGHPRHLLLYIASCSRCIFLH